MSDDGSCSSTSIVSAARTVRLFLQRRGRPQRSVTNGLHGLDHPLPEKLSQLDSHRTAPLQRIVR